jgi:hypothetical protein
MAEKQNSAFRLLHFCRRMVEQTPGNQTTAQVLLRAFGEKGNSQTARQETVQVARVISLLSSEVELMIGESNRLGFSESSRQPIVNAFERFSISGLASQWQASRLPFVNALPLLQIFAEGLGDEGALIAEPEIVSLSEAIGTLRLDVENSELPDDVKQFVYEQLNLIERAVRDYPLAGAKAFKTAMREAIFHQADHVEAVETLKKTKQMITFKAIWRKVCDLSKYAIDASRLLTAGDEIYSHGQKVAHTASEAMHHVGGIIDHMK